MWLLDVNVDVRLKALLREVGVTAKTAIELGWRDLVNGDLVNQAREAGFTALLTRDRLLIESASRSLKGYSNFAIVILTLKQQKFPAYTAAFRSAWAKGPIEPVVGRSITWPATDQ
jgi:hypothetical protein